MKSITTILIWTVILTAVVLAQATEKQPKSNTIIVHLNFNLLDEKSQPLTHLSKENFAVYENNIPQQISSVDTHNEAVSYALLIDTSSRVREQLKIYQSFAKTLIAALTEKDELSLGHIKENPELVTAFTSNKRDMVDALEDLFISGYAPMIDGILASESYLKKDGKNPRRTVVVITDGLEIKSQTPPMEVSDYLGKDDVQVFIILLPNDRFMPPNDLAKRDAKNTVKGYATLNAIASASGGKVIPIYGMQDFEKAVKEITDLTKATYRLGYSSTNIERRGNLRKVRIEAKSPEGKTITRNDSYTPVK